MTTWYNEDLAYIHDVGFRDHALKSAPEILKIFKDHQIESGLVVDLGCGSGLGTEIFARQGYQMLGIDISEAMIAMARIRVPSAKFQVGSLFTAEIPTCRAVISLGECLSYAFDANSDAVLDSLFRRIYQALLPSGVLIFDVVIPGHTAPDETVKGFTEGEDWLVLVEKHEDSTLQVLTRRIIALRKVGDYYRRSDEIHCQRLFNPEALAEVLSQVGFRVEISHRYGDFCLLPARIAVIAHKPVNRE
jgi:SAM-dependent methyltransferase